MTVRKKKAARQTVDLFEQARGVWEAAPPVLEYIAYTEGYKYQLAETYVVRLPEYARLGLTCEAPFVRLYGDGVLVILKGWAWDGASGGAMDTDALQRAAVVHDALYYLMRQRRLIAARDRGASDRIIRRLYRIDARLLLGPPPSAWSWRRPAYTARLAWIETRGGYIYRLLKVAGGKAADPDSKKVVRYAPRRPEKVVRTEADDVA